VLFDSVNVNYIYNSCKDGNRKCVVSTLERHLHELLNGSASTQKGTKLNNFKKKVMKENETSVYVCAIIQHQRQKSLRFGDYSHLP